MTTHAPGSDAAVAAGCECPIIDNHRGLGIRGPNGEVWHWRNSQCPLHGEPVPEQETPPG